MFDVFPAHRLAPKETSSRLTNHPPRRRPTVCTKSQRLRQRRGRHGRVQLATQQPANLLCCSFKYHKVGLAFGLGSFDDGSFDDPDTPETPATCKCVFCVIWSHVVVWLLQRTNYMSCLLFL